MEIHDHAHELRLIFLKCTHYPKWYVDSCILYQSINDILARTRKKQMHHLYGNTKGFTIAEEKCSERKMEAS